MVQRVEWSQDRNSVHLSGQGFHVEGRVDAQMIHLTGDISFLGGLLSGPLASGLKQIVERAFHKRLT
jgi:hypothetical protein